MSGLSDSSEVGQDVILDFPEVSQEFIKFCSAGRTNEVVIDFITVCFEVAHCLVAMITDVNHENHLLLTLKPPKTGGWGFESP